jgi:ABC-type phosphate/phosphonate transport system permease subunit
MITMSILWALVIGLFAINRERPNERKRIIMHAKGNAIRNVDWALWFAVFSPVIGILLGVLGVFILER